VFRSRPDLLQALRRTGHTKMTAMRKLPRHNHIQQRSEKFGLKKHANRDARIRPPLGHQHDEVRRQC